MQIHELTQHSLNEGFMDQLKSTTAKAKGVVGSAINKIGQANDYVNTKTAQAGNKIMAANKALGKAMPAPLQRMTGDYGSSAAGVAQGMEKKGFGMQYQPPSDNWRLKYRALKSDPAVTQFSQAIADAWPKFEKSQLKTRSVPTPVAAPPAGTAPPTPVAAPPAGTAPPTQYAKVGKDKLNPNDPADAKIIAAMKSQGYLEETGTPEEDRYAETFVRWSDEKLKTREKTTGETIDMDDVRDISNLNTQLITALEKVVNTRGTPEQNAAIFQYCMLASAGVQAVAQKIKNKNPRSNSSVIASTMKPAMQQKLSTLGVSPMQQAQIGKVLQTNGDKTFRETGNAQVDAFLMTLGMTPI